MSKSELPGGIPMLSPQVAGPRWQGAGTGDAPRPVLARGGASGIGNCLWPLSFEGLLVGVMVWLNLSASMTSLRCRAAGVTVITHGLNGNVDDWVIAMADRMTGYPRFPGTNFTCYELYFTLSGANYVLTWRRLGGGAPSDTDSGEILIKLDWRQLANDDYSTYDVAAMVVPQLLQRNFIAELNGHALAELPLHLIGHSRGGSLVCQLSYLLGTNGVWVDHLTTLDPHPLNNDGFVDFPYSVVDASARTYENVLFHDNYFQNLNVLFYGEPVAGAYVRQLTDLDGGYGGIAASHSDVHLWYHGTVDLRVPADDTVASITSAERQTWWTPYESSGAVAGFYYSLIGQGDRLSADRPAGQGTDSIRDGYNQRWDLGAGLSNNRTALPPGNRRWPNLIKFNLTGTNVMLAGQSNMVAYYYQWSQPASSNATVNVYVDDDFNPYNGNERLVGQVNVPGTGPDQIGSGTVSIVLNATNVTPGSHALCARISAGADSRYLYAPEILTVFSSFEPPSLALARDAGGQFRIELTGVPGQRVVLQSAPDLHGWQPLATNWLETNVWSYFDNVSENDRRFYRATLQ